MLTPYMIMKVAVFCAYAVTISSTFSSSWMINRLNRANRQRPLIRLEWITAASPLGRRRSSWTDWNDAGEF